mgnify:CR=1 FL=1
MMALGLFSCDKEPVIDDDVPQCIVDMINDFAETAIIDCNPTIKPSVISYRFQNEIVYAFDMGNCISDGSVEVFNGNCERICVLGTIIGITECRGEPFDNAVKLEVLWEK